MTDSDDWAASLSGPPKKPMKRGTKIFLWLFAALVAWLTLSNATWLAPDPVGKRVLIAHRGVSQLFDHRGVTDDSCTATRIYPPEHAYIENSLPSMKVAIGRDAGAVKFDVAATKDGRLAVFHDWTLDCRTDGKGNIRDRTMAELKRLDIGYGYTADGGKTFPLRGKGEGLMPSLDDVLRDLGHASLIVNFKSRDPREGALALAAFARAGIDPNQPRFGFFGNARVLRPIRARAPRAWTLDPEGAKRCTGDYIKFGWSGWYPPSCVGGTIIVPLDYQWAYWGWPDRLQARAAAHGTRVLMTGARGDKHGGMGLWRVDQLTRIPASFTGYVWIDDIYNLGPALRPRQK
ncbi:glycerophosphodiester phosphodiesterase family protein [Sphingopyxis terrae]|uniref:Glycerophosphoryl diester phosphodiesterase n=1 Tax=Sphingopyxis terrae subsp. ummariensis TaxID=429001 RepID=A0A1Y6EQW1_9SPHN|nr:glycerophosphodiester phosphodiesterase family protein [Sphingopyxis terrae]SMQ65098.1 glycerophosphoryl diester phosphodiesterase [Sphingopyxis terrae subsp. ummariensis]